MFTDCYCTQFRRASAAITRIYDRALKPVGLRITQFSMLRSLGRLGQATSTQLAQELALDRTTVSRGVKTLIDAGWVDVAEAEDRRERVLSLNKAGQRAIAEAMPYFLTAQTSVEQKTHDFAGDAKNHRLLGALVTLQGESLATID